MEAGHAIEPERAPGRVRVLIADDDDDLRQLVASVLSHEGYDVVEVSDGSMLLDYMHHVRNDPRMLPPDIIISDICMPERSGLDAISTLRLVHVTIPVVLMTAFPETGTYDSVEHLGSAMILTKPFSLDDLRAAVAASMHQ